MPRHRIVSYGDTPEIEALSTGFARQGFFKQGYEKARIFANVTTSSSLAARIKPDGTHTSARFAYATGIYEPDMGGIFAVGTSAKDLAAELNFKSPRALQTAFEKGMLDPDPSMPGTNRALVKGKPLFKFKEVAAVPSPQALAQAPVAKALAAVSTSPTFRAPPPTFVKHGATALDVHQTSSATHRAAMNQRAAVSYARMANSPAYQARTAAKFTDADLDAHLHKLMW